MIDKSVFILFIFSFNFILVIIHVNGQLSIIGSECWSDIDCTVRDSRCVNYRCACSDPYVASQDLKACTVVTGDLCLTSSTICHDPNARCNATWNGYCVCSETFVQHTDTRVCLQALNQNCTEDGIACVDGSCENDRCQCPQPLVANSFKNRCVTALGDNCVLNQECSDPHASCLRNGPCVCNDGFQQVQHPDGSTLCARILGATCDKDEDCGAENSFCESMKQGTTICNCREGYERSSDMRKCLEIPRFWPGSCEEDRQCKGAFGSLSRCSTSTCVCPRGYQFSENDGGCILQISIMSRT